jgi:3-isopropylmalate dehydratase small subunit
VLLYCLKLEREVTGMILINIAVSVFIASSAYDIYVNYQVKKGNDEIRRTNQQLEKEIKGLKVSKNINISIDGKELVKTINEEQRKVNTTLLND